MSDELSIIVTAAKWLAGAAPPTVALWRLLSHDRALLYAFLPKLGKKVDARKLQETLIIESQKAYVNHLKSLSQQENALTQKLFKASPEKRTLIERDLEYVEARKREFDIKFSALVQITKESETGNKSAISGPSAAISGHWMDRFNELVRQRNEPWRTQLLKDALVKEAMNPGCISPRVLWLVGILEPAKFEILAALLNIATTVNGEPIVPGRYVRTSRELIPGLAKGAHPLDIAATSLMDTGLVQDTDVVITLEVGDTLIASYDKKKIRITALDLRASVGGILFTDLGNSIATLYKPEVNETGRKLFDRWIPELIPASFAVEKL